MIKNTPDTTTKPMPSTPNEEARNVYPANPTIGARRPGKMVQRTRIARPRFMPASDRKAGR